MATFNGTLKYKQDDGSIVELNPVGVDARARTLATAAGQTANNAQTAAENVQQTVNGIATQIQLIEQTTGYNASLEDVPATSIKESIEDLDTIMNNLDTTINNLDTSVGNLETRVRKLERLPTLDFPIIGIFTGTGPNNTITIAVPIPSVVRLLSAKGHVPTFSISGGIIGVVFEYNDANTINSFALSSVSVSDLGVFVSITGKPAPSSLAIYPGTFVWSSYKQAATVTTLHVTFS